VPRRGLDSEQVLQAAIALADDGGLEHVTFARLAGLVGVRAPSLYNHVNGRAALLRLITLRGLEQLTEAIAAAAAGLAGEDALRASGHAYRAYAHEHPGSYAAILGAPSETDTELQAAAEGLIELLAAILRGWKLEGDDAIDAIRVVRSALHGFVTLERQGGFAMERDVDESFERLLDTLVAGLRGVAAQRRTVSVR
jgi:AcrR family transcriptional regulator